MKAPPFAYARPKSLAEALDLLQSHGDDARVLAGGQSLLAALNMRLSAPRLLVDITRIPGLSGIKRTDSKITIGALTTHAEIERSPEIARALPLLTQAAPHIAHAAIRNAGTIGGSLALADPAAEWPACCVALDATFILAGKKGRRRVKAREFFHDLYATSLKPAEVLTAVEISVPPAGSRSIFLELTRRRGDYAMAGVAAVAKLARNALTDVHLAYLGVGRTPVLARKAMAAIEGKPLSAATIKAAQDALSGDLDPDGDVYSAPATKLHYARVLTRRALEALHG